MPEQPRVPRSVSKAEFLQAVRDGVHDAMWEMITGATQMPSADFYATIQAGVEAAMKAVARERETPIATPLPRDAGETPPERQEASAPEEGSKL